MNDKVKDEMIKLVSKERKVVVALLSYGQLIEAGILRHKTTDEENNSFLRALATLVAYIDYLKQQTGATEQGFTAEIDRQTEAEKDSNLISFTAYKIRNGHV